mmetsp:Transcript_7654/g.12931  ORF Transcript_7654/g.12931 Transcript_7654/m.12931 type:complete len:374 (-) Transcript_7654:487-1608(-)
MAPILGGCVCLDASLRIDAVLVFVFDADRLMALAVFCRIRSKGLPSLLLLLRRLPSAVATTVAGFDALTATAATPPPSSLLSLRLIRLRRAILGKDQDLPPRNICIPAPALPAADAVLVRVLLLLAVDCSADCEAEAAAPGITALLAAALGLDAFISMAVVVVANCCCCNDDGGGDEVIGDSAGGVRSAVLGSPDSAPVPEPVSALAATTLLVAGGAGATVAESLRTALAAAAASEAVAIMSGISAREIALAPGAAVVLLVLAVAPATSMTELVGSLESTASLLSRAALSLSVTCSSLLLMLLVLLVSLLGVVTPAAWPTIAASRDRPASSFLEPVIPSAPINAALFSQTRPSTAATRTNGFLTAVFRPFLAR